MSDAISGHPMPDQSGRSVSPEHDEFCLDLVYGWYDDQGKFHAPVATLEDDFAAHQQYHRRMTPPARTTPANADDSC